MWQHSPTRHQGTLDGESPARDNQLSMHGLDPYAPVHQPQPFSFLKQQQQQPLRTPSISNHSLVHLTSGGGSRNSLAVPLPDAPLSSVAIDSTSYTPSKKDTTVSLSPSKLLPTSVITQIAETAIGTSPPPERVCRKLPPAPTPVPTTLAVTTAPTSVSVPVSATTTTPYSDKRASNHRILPQPTAVSPVSIPEPVVEPTVPVKKPSTVVKKFQVEPPKLMIVQSSQEKPKPIGSEPVKKIPLEPFPIKQHTGGSPVRRLPQISQPSKQQVVPFEVEPSPTPARLLPILPNMGRPHERFMNIVAPIPNSIDLSTPTRHLPTVPTSEHQSTYRRRLPEIRRKSRTIEGTRGNPVLEESILFKSASLETRSRSPSPVRMVPSWTEPNLEPSMVSTCDDFSADTSSYSPKFSARRRLLPNPGRVLPSAIGFRRKMPQVPPIPLPKESFTSPSLHNIATGGVDERDNYNLPRLLPSPTQVRKLQSSHVRQLPTVPPTKEGFRRKLPNTENVAAASKLKRERPVDVEDSVQVMTTSSSFHSSRQAPNTTRMISSVSVKQRMSGIGVISLLPSGSEEGSETGGREEDENEDSEEKIDWF